MSFRWASLTHQIGCQTNPPKAYEWEASENNRKAKYYKLTAAGRKQLSAETETWRRFTGAVELILKTS